jgi:hypothetical protein
MAIAARERYEEEDYGRCMMEDEEDIVDRRDPEPQEENDGRNSPLSSMFGEVTVFRDFFFAALYNSVCRIDCVCMLDVSSRFLSSHLTHLSLCHF